MKWKQEFTEKGDGSFIDIKYGRLPVIRLWNSALDESDLFDAADQIVKILNDSHATASQNSVP